MMIAGRFVLLALAGVIPLFWFPQLSTALIWCGVLALALLADIVFAVSPCTLSITRRLPRGARLGEQTSADLLLRNTGKRTFRGQLEEGWQPSAGIAEQVQRLRLPGGERRLLNFTMQPRRRGELRSDVVTIRSYGPLGLAGRQVTLPVPGRVMVLPAFRARRHLPSALRKLRELDGRAAVQIRGAGTEFDSLRDYVRGDDVRSIDWRATAWRQSVVVRTWRPERDRRVVILLDSSRTAAARVEDEPRFDTSIEASLLLSVLAERGGDRVSVIAFDRRVRAHVGSSQQGNLLGSLATALASIQPELIELDWERIPAQIRSATAHRALVVLLTSLDTGAAAETLIPVVSRLARDHTVVVASVRDPALLAMAGSRADRTQVYQAAAAERALLEREAVLTQLNRLGAEVVDAAPEELPPLLADAYIRLKAAGRL
ncbi:DUF58 domain-containing protein [Acaricomes phytoseiuli]|uniref:DUF58 domain-containing protein n=1 Tax=Acaricomes phytoseiuli TaxID=291968 RepID=UPI002221BC23|nr:DUF58 domain-containing protein [Acaricomes phytoseiuli]MCW1249429.1 DUF58 domain-containing protein [Acaricomes phytoseiuli]